MWWNKTRDIVIKAITIVERTERKFDEHVKDGEQRQADIVNLIKECHESCPEKERFDDHKSKQNGSLQKIEETLLIMKTAKKTKKELWLEALRIIGIIGVITAGILGYLRYTSMSKPDSDIKVEHAIQKFLQKTIDKSLSE